jgi:hypothetical protein
VHLGITIHFSLEYKCTQQIICNNKYNNKEMSVTDCSTRTPSKKRVGCLSLALLAFAIGVGMTILHSLL